jgi:hypothetical protein
VWRVYYGDGSTFSSEDGSPAAAPALDVQVIVQHRVDVGWHMQHANDFYLWRDCWRCWRGADLAGLWDYMMQAGWKRVLMGRTLLNSEFNAIYQAAKADRDFARQHGELPDA